MDAVTQNSMSKQMWRQILNLEGKKKNGACACCQEFKGGITPTKSAVSENMVWVSVLMITDWLYHTNISDHNKFTTTSAQNTQIKYI